jgi:hypothetical protein
MPRGPLPKRRKGRSRLDCYKFEEEEKEEEEEGYLWIN